MRQIHFNSQTSATISQQTRENSDSLVDMVHRLEGTVRRFRV